MEQPFFEIDGKKWFQERLTAAVGNSFLVEKLLYCDQSEHQSIIVFENSIFGRMLAINNIVQVAQADEFIYHEMVAHVPMFGHGNVKDVLIVGGGDGGVLRELFRHQSVESATLVEIDRDVISFSKEWMPMVSNGAFDDPRLEVVIADGAEYVRNVEKKFDLIIIDSTDPVGPGVVLFTKEFYTDCRAALKDNGILITQNGLPFLQGAELASSINNCAELFKIATPYLITVPSYSGGAMALGWMSDNEAAFNIDPAALKRRFDEAAFDCRYYNPATHRAAFNLPEFVARIVS